MVKWRLYDMSHQRKVETEVANLYSHLWGHLSSFRTQEVINQFLYNVDLPSSWFQGKLCFDAGCGPGHAAWAMQQLGATCHALDLGFASLRLLRGVMDTSNVVINATVHKLPFEGDTFDFVYCSGVLHHTTDPLKGFLELTRVTAPNGMLYVSLYGKGGLYNLSLHLGRLMARFLPYDLVETAISVVVRDRTVPNSFMPAKISILDNLYVPIRKEYREQDLRGWFASVQFNEVVRTKTTIYDYQKSVSRLVHGQGYLQLRGIKSADSRMDFAG